MGKGLGRLFTTFTDLLLYGWSISKRGVCTKQTLDLVNKIREVRLLRLCKRGVFSARSWGHASILLLLVVFIVAPPWGTGKPPKGEPTSTAQPAAVLCPDGLAYRLSQTELPEGLWPEGGKRNPAITYVATNYYVTCENFDAYMQALEAGSPTATAYLMEMKHAQD